ncbi:MAG: transposase [Armatimonadetes bacterium]|nr:transposase [Armatimonadota bacterium]
MSSKRCSEDQIVKGLQQIDNGASMVSIARLHGIAVQTIYAWSKRFAGMGSSELAELKTLQAENTRLKRIVASQAMDIDALKELQRGKW